MKFTLNKNIFNIQINAACESTLNMFVHIKQISYFGDMLYLMT